MVVIQWLYDLSSENFCFVGDGRKDKWGDFLKVINEWSQTENPYDRLLQSNCRAKRKQTWIMSCTLTQGFLLRQTASAQMVQLFSHLMASLRRNVKVWWPFLNGGMRTLWGRQISSLNCLKSLLCGELLEHYGFCYLFCCVWLMYLMMTGCLVDSLSLERSWLIVVTDALTFFTEVIIRVKSKVVFSQSVNLPGPSDSCGISGLCVFLRCTPLYGLYRMCSPKGYGFWAVLVINRVLILAHFDHFGNKYATVFVL